MLRSLAQAGGGTYEFFDTKMKHTWAEKVNHTHYCIVFNNLNLLTVTGPPLGPLVITCIKYLSLNLK